MKGNDLGNQRVPRDLIVWEGLLGILPDAKAVQKHNRLVTQKRRGKSRWAEAVALYEINEMLSRQLWRRVWNQGRVFDLITWVGPEFALALADRMDRENLPFNEIWSDEPYVLARRLATMPDVRSVVDPDPQHRLVFGGKGLIIGPDGWNSL